ncbi:hypothetical protein THMIRHAS_21570 [Thiosulfatimonas sediminis]|uniref:PAS domain-containing protein n=1 Tax=Thiosulfatimonas sediminis TaxID=2675054 RepID=A0A6F8PXR0_9GAMM|nr:PhnD/SsuA/transferrin family substrate-binding protein [Thiosulfatimonas sediminis]BBP46784.1 hypothetical protein THMIRHAS_21570 [Thiosulfatimonas sediminis]
MKPFMFFSTVLNLLKACRFWLGYLALGIIAVLVMLPNFVVADTSSSVIAKPLPQERVLGVLALNGTKKTIEQWTPMLDYLNARLELWHFRLQPLAFSEFESAVAQRKIDYLIANPALYVALEKKYQVFRIGTLTREIKGQQIEQFGGVIVSAKGVDVKTVLSLHQEQIAAVDNYSLGGYLLQKQMLAKQLNIPINENRVAFYHNHQYVVDAVISGDKKVGFVRTGVLEWADKSEQLEVFRPPQTPLFPLKLSTELFPEWPLASLAHISYSEATQVMQQLFNWQSPVMHMGAVERYSWTVPQNYLAVHQLLQDFRLEPYQQPPQLDFHAWLAQYREWGYFLGVLLLGLVLMSGLLGRKTSRNRHKSQQLLPLQQEQQQKIAELQLQLKQAALEAERWSIVHDSFHQGILVFSISGRVLFNNHTIVDYLGYAQNELTECNVYQLFANSHDRNLIHSLVASLEVSENNPLGIQEQPFELITASGESRTFRMSILPVCHAVEWWLIMRLEALS